MEPYYIEKLHGLLSNAKKSKDLSNISSIFLESKIDNDKDNEK
jgi:hypothetical protein